MGAAAVALFPLTVMAQTTPPPPAPPADVAAAPPAVPGVQKTWKDMVTFEGLADAYGSFRPGGSQSVPLGFRVFDAPTDTFSLAFAKLAVGVKADPVGMRLDLGFGPVADLTASTPNAEVWKHILQAYGTFAVGGTTPLTIDIGKFVTAAGAEVIEAHANWNYSRSFLFGYAIPFTHTGVRLTAPLSSALTLQVMLANGWDNSIDNNAGKTLGVSATFVAPTGTTIIGNVMAGPEPQMGAGNPWRFLVDAVVSQSFGKLSLNANFDYGHQDTFNWWGLAAYARAPVTSMMNLSVRGEIFQDREGFRLGLPLGSYTVEEITVTAGFPVGNNAELRAEARFDFAGDTIYAYEPMGTDAKKFQSSLTGAALVWF
jgi:hypothetical protein